MPKHTIVYNMMYYVWIAYLALFFSSCSVIKTIDKTDIEKYQKKDITLYLHDNTKVKLKSSEYPIVDSADSQWIKGVGRINNASVKSSVVLNLSDVQSIHYEDQFAKTIGIGVTVGLFYLIIRIITGLGKIKVG